MMVCIMVLMIALTIAAVLIEKDFSEYVSPLNSSTTLTYKQLEEKVIEATKKYQELNYKNLKENEEISVTIKTLKRSDLLSNIKDIKTNENCTGYATFVKENNNIKYNAYIKCDNYETNGYQDSMVR